MKKFQEKFKNVVFYSFLMHFVNLLCSILPNNKRTNKLRGFLLKPFFLKCGSNFQVASGVIFINSKNIEIGNNVYIAHNAWINGTGNLKVHSNCIISPMVVIATTKHEYSDGKVSNLKGEVAPVTIGEGTWIASNSVVTKGVQIGKGCIIGACSVVTKNIEDYYFAAGSPAKELKKIHNT